MDQNFLASSSRPSPVIEAAAAIGRVCYDLGYIQGFGDGEQRIRTLIQNRFTARSGSRAAYEFIKTALHDDQNMVEGASVGIFDGQLYVWLVIADIDVTMTRRLFDLKSAIEQAEQSEFELHVAPLQGRSLNDVIPKSFELVSF